ncbi:annexin Max4, partial [Burkholderia pseudomallei]
VAGRRSPVAGRRSPVAGRQFGRSGMPSVPPA